MVIERFHVQRGVDVQVSSAVNDVSQRGTILEFRSAGPRVVGIIRGIAIKPVEDWQFVKR